MTIDWKTYCTWAHESGTRKSGPGVPDHERAALLKIWGLGLGGEALEFFVAFDEWLDGGAFVSVTGGVLLVDEADLVRVNEFTWSLTGQPGAKYAYRWIDKLQKKCILLHRFILGVDESDPRVVDHINGDRLDNRRKNLRLVTQQQNSVNKKMSSNNKSGTAGLWWDEDRQKWQAYINVNKRRVTLGRFDNKEDAIAARKAAEIEHFGEFVRKEDTLKKAWLLEVSDLLFYIARLYVDTGNERREQGPFDGDGEIRNIFRGVGNLVECMKKAYRAEGDAGLLRLCLPECHEMGIRVREGSWEQRPGRREEFGALLDRALGAVEAWLVARGSSLSTACEANVEKLVARRKAGLISAQGERVSELGRAVRPEDTTNAAGEPITHNTYFDALKQDAERRYPRNLATAGGIACGRPPESVYSRATLLPGGCSNGGSHHDVEACGQHGPPAASLPPEASTSVQHLDPVAAERVARGRCPSCDGPKGTHPTGVCIACYVRSRVPGAPAWSVPRPVDADPLRQARLERADLESRILPPPKPGPEIPGPKRSG